MATRTQTLRPIDQRSADGQPDIKALIAERDALVAQIRQMKATRMTGSKLDAVISRQHATISTKKVGYFVARVKARVAAGQSEADALEQTFAFYRAAVIEALANPPVEPSKAEELDEADEA